MLNKIIQFSVKNKLVIGLMVLALIAWGIYSVRQLPIDAVPDITTLRTAASNPVPVPKTSSALSPSP